MGNVKQADFGPARGWEWDPTNWGFSLDVPGTFPDHIHVPHTCAVRMSHLVIFLEENRVCFEQVEGVLARLGVELLVQPPEAAALQPSFHLAQQALLPCRVIAVIGRWDISVCWPLRRLLDLLLLAGLLRRLILVSPGDRVLLVEYLRLRWLILQALPCIPTPLALLVCRPSWDVMLLSSINSGVNALG